MSKQELRIGLIGYNFMGKAHSQAWRNAPLYFEMEAKPILKAVCGRSKDRVSTFAQRWGWEDVETDWRRLIERNDIDVIDVSTPTYLHHDMVIAAAQAGKHIFCEKPFALSSEEAQRMLEAAETAGITHCLNHNYRRCPAVRLARKLIDEKKLGRIFHWRGAYLQSWIVDPNFPLTWQLQAKFAGAGPHYDLNSHSVDLARYLVGEISTVSAMTSRFVTQRPLPAANATAFQGNSESEELGEVTVEDAAFMTVQFENGALGSFEASRFALGRKNYNMFEIYGSEGALRFNLERMNELEYFNGTDPEAAQGFRTILATEPCHEYISNWWPPGHTIGYEHEFTHAVVDFFKAVSSGCPVEPNFRDGVACMKVLEAGLRSANNGSCEAVT
ncbi:Gfo/Idh/MocA family protein [Bythopirellula polymerisocia]|uniref:1,5-anhydro-D-fructose reductase n=1 Tax=Bythopirellula polymerisocia TaxID=2528003 RepID=A0A5C6CDC7_9BACT|nr:Gfo/Idh/MocA family oxidoreductase [Bythopirellula polymerisocia]TWU21376.1 1,5-anhydro-D-fructose reductase [Bythopirellula polymerisocia]